MNKYFYIILFLPFLFGCNAHEKIINDGQAYENFRGFVPVDPIEYEAKVAIADSGKIITKEIKLLSSDEVLQFLNNETVLVSIGKINAEQGIAYLPISISEKHTSYKVTMDYMKFATLAQVDEDAKFIGFNRVGVGLRLITLITTSEAGINIGDLYSIGLAAKAGKVKGTLMIEVVGIKSKEETTLLPLPSEINQTTIQNAMQALATIKSKIYENETKLFPQVMAIKPDSAVNNPKRGKKDTLIAEGVNNNKGVSNDVKLQIGANKITSNKLQLAQNLESEAFGLLFNKRINEAIAKFDECASIYPEFHSVYEISRMLKTEKNELSNPDSTKWREVYAAIYKNYSWKLTNDIIEKLKAESNRPPAP